MKDLYIGIMGGDTRTIHMANALAQDGFQVFCMFLESPRLSQSVHRVEDFRDALPFCSVLVLPVPICTKELALNAPFWPKERNRDIGQFLEDIGKITLVLGGAPSPQVRQAFAQRELRLVDFMERNDLALANALPTAEGAVALAMQHLEVTICGARCMVVGCGRCGRVLARLLAAMGAQVTVTARRRGQLTWIADRGWEPLDTGSMVHRVGEMDVIFNTVPSPVIARRELDAMGPETILIDLASAPGGIDFTYAAQKGLTALTAPGLPGKAAPKTAGLILRDAVVSILQERGMIPWQSKT